MNLRCKPCQLVCFEHSKSHFWTWSWCRRCWCLRLQRICFACFIWCYSFWMWIKLVRWFSRVMMHQAFRCYRIHKIWSIWVPDFLISWRIKLQRNRSCLNLLISLTIAIVVLLIIGSKIQHVSLAWIKIFPILILMNRILRDFRWLLADRLIRFWSLVEDGP